MIEKMQLERNYLGDYLRGKFLKVTDTHGMISSRDPGDLDQTPISFPINYDHINEAVAAARRSFLSWLRLSTQDRANYLNTYLELFKKNSERIAHALSLEGGKPLWESRQETQQSAKMMAHILSVSPAVDQASEVPLEDSGLMGSVRYRPRGVLAIIVSSQIPVLEQHMIAFSALLNGNAIVMKSSAQYPFTAQCIAEIIHAAELPEGLWNILHGNSESARRLTTHDDVDGIFFSGPYETALKVRKQVAPAYWKSVVVLSGGKNGTLVWEDAQYKKALTECLYSAYLSSGQRISNSNRVLVHDKLFDKFVDDFHKLSKTCSIGYSLETEKEPNFMGPLANEEMLERYLRYQGIATREGCHEIMRGKRLEKDHKGYYVSPSIHYVQEPSPKSLYQKEEIHGPNVALYRVQDLDQAIEILNLTPYGLAAGVYTQDRTTFEKLHETVRVGMLYWNQPTTEIHWQLPYGGIKRSGNYRPLGSLTSEQCIYRMTAIADPKASLNFPLPEWLPQLK